MCGGGVSCAQEVVAGMWVEIRSVTGRRSFGTNMTEGAGQVRAEEARAEEVLGGVRGYCQMGYKVGEAGRRTASSAACKFRRREGQKGGPGQARKPGEAGRRGRTTPRVKCRFQGRYSRETQAISLRYRIPEARGRYPSAAAFIRILVQGGGRAQAKRCGLEGDSGDEKRTRG
ncbi:hypothetical protein B0H12DRAFT_1078572 [Mycena haematopus]|nr:hypothetical protein B0H12DRAFT_1078572 [Mycena haematopus]